MAKELSVILAGEDRDLAEVLNELRKVKIAPLHLEMVALTNLRETVKRTHPHLVIYDTDGNADFVRRTAAAMADEFPDTHWAVVSKETDVNLILQFFRMGAADFLREPVQSEEVKRLIQKIVDLESDRHPETGEDVHRTIALFSTKGGVGLTTLASNLGVELARKKPGNVLLLDLVLQHGNIADFLDLPLSYTLMDVIENFERLDFNLLEHSLVKHPSGLYVLPCPKQPEDEDFIVSNPCSEVFQFMKGHFRYVIADLGHEFSKTAISFLDLADLIFLVTTPDVPSLSNARNALSTFIRLGYNPSKIKVVLNRWKMKGEIDPAIIQKTVHADIFCRLPDDSLNCLSAVNQGKPISDVAKRGELSKGIERLAAFLLEPIKKGDGHVSS